MNHFLWLGPIKGYCSLPIFPFLLWHHFWERTPKKHIACLLPTNLEVLIKCIEMLSKAMLCQGCSWVEVGMDWNTKSSSSSGITGVRREVPPGTRLERVCHHTAWDSLLWSAVCFGPSCCTLSLWIVFLPLADDSMQRSLKKGRVFTFKSMRELERLWAIW